MHTLKNNWIVFFLLLIAGAGRAQTSFEETYNREVIAYQTDNRFIKDGKVLKRSEVRLLLMKYPESAAEYKKFQKNRRIANVLAVASLGFYTGSFFLLGDNPNAAMATLIASSGIVLTTIPFSVKSMRSLQQAIFIYNREVLKDACQK